MSKQNIQCKFLSNDTCRVIQKLSSGILNDCKVTSEFCNKCSEQKSPNTINRLTIASTLNRLRQDSKFSIVQHYDLVNAIQCSIGTGTQLHGYLKWFKSADCGCEHKVALMNTWGPDECKKQFNTIMGWLEEASILVQFNFIHTAVECVLAQCIRESARLHKDLDLEWIYNV